MSGRKGCLRERNPGAGLIADAGGNLFGTTEYGGASGYGTAFEIAKSAAGYATTPTTLVSFNGADGANPLAGLIADAGGNLFGTTQFGPTETGTGTVFEIAKTAAGYASTPTTLVSFNFSDGAGPSAGLIADAGGNLFGTTIAGGASGQGTVFEIAKTAAGYASTPTTLVSFNLSDGAFPYAGAGLIADVNGNLFGTTLFGGASSSGGASGYGTAFEIAKTAAGGYATTPTTLVSFNGGDGAYPLAGLIADANGNLFGTTFNGGASNYGTAFEIAKSAAGYASTPTTLVSFSGGDGANPRAGLIADAAGNLFGTTSGGGASGNGTVFELAGSGFVPPVVFVGVPGAANCIGQSISALAQTYGGIAHAAASLGYASVADLHNAVASFCGG